VALLVAEGWTDGQEGVIGVDATELPKQGHCSAGVQRH
jgi:hypothetical protein